MDEINRKRLEWVATAEIGTTFDENLFGPIDGMGNGWGPALSEAAQAALDELESMRRWKAEHIADWRPIETAPLEPAEAVNVDYRFYCLLQWSNYLGERVTGEGYAKYVRGELKWRSYGNAITPKFWMPLPAPKD